MDNRRVIHSYREKQAASTSSTPYSRPTSGLFSKVKQYFAPASLWSNEEQQEQSQTMSHSQSQSHTQPPSQASSVSPFKFPEPELKTPLKKNSKDVTKTPNHVLSTFFQSKGDRPLTDVEYEGVVALLSKSHQNTPTTVKNSQNNQQRQSQTPSQRFTSQDDIKVGSNNKRGSHGGAAANSSNLFITPYNQKVLKNDSSIFSTPEYKPIYHSVNENSFSQGRGAGMSSIPSVKRVYQFSGLPSPYRTRIRTPNLSAKKKNISKSNASFASNGTFNSSLSNTITAPPTSSIDNKPLSNTANALLTILDGGDESNEASIKAFTSPFARQKRVNKDREMESTPVKKRLTAADIGKTISFDQSEKLPELEKVVEKEEKLEEKPANLKNGIAKEETTKHTFAFPNSSTKPLHNDSSTKTNLSTSTDTTAASTFTFGRTTGETTSDNTPFPTTTEGEKPTIHKTTSNSLFGDSEKTSVQIPKLPISNGSNGSSFSFGAAKQPLTDNKPTSLFGSNSNTLNIKQTAGFEFKLPELKQQQVVLDQKKVESFKSLFEF
ncbi:nucleoporin Nup60p [[Candida] railenensis]|uniref:Nucleoporin Nup60p n=1 Tax=[Candida] railenensis TaxID=45579 RepID=A0A9P0QM37_9ASCO|nr:nucleoporin Nup60p [[Candida] railenensis]